MTDCTPVNAIARPRRPFESLQRQTGRVILWLLGTVAGVAAIAGYWYLDTRGYLDRVPLPEFVKDILPTQKSATKPLYRWRDDQGQVHISDQPPPGRPYETVAYPKEANVIPADPDKPR
jgi:hypothetical protein